MRQITQLSRQKTAYNPLNPGKAKLVRKTPGFEQMLAELVSRPSVSSSRAELDQGNLAVIDQLANWLEPLGFVTEVIPLPGKAGKGNLIARLGHGEGGLVLAGHTDTVPFDADLWSR
jgi:acetylornithine deacetylase